jgi:hypothetical protein
MGARRITVSIGIGFGGFSTFFGFSILGDAGLRFVCFSFVFFTISIYLKYSNMKNIPTDPTAIGNNAHIKSLDSIFNHHS